MKKFTTNCWLRHRLKPSILALATSGALFGVILNAQDDIDLDEDVFQLSPFIVEESGEVGYLATSTLAGTRIKTELRDLPNSIAIATEEMINDLGIDDASELLPYLGNIETAGPDGSYGGGTGTATILFTDANRNPQNANRIRGLARADNTRNYLPTGILMDSYNTERVAVNRGPNSILFGLGSPGGIVNTQTISARMRDSNKILLKYSSFNSTRASMDINREIIDDKLAIRFAAMAEDKYWRQEPTFKRSKRATVALLWRPFENANFKMSLEQGEIDARKPRPNAPRDTFTRWWHPAFNKVTHDTGNVDFGVIDRDIVRAPGEWFGQPGLVYESTGETYYMHRAWETSRPGGQRLRNHMVSITKGEQWYQSPTAAEYGIVDGAFWGDQELLDRNVFDWVEILLDGPNKAEWERFGVFNVSYDQTWRFDMGSAGFELTYGNETMNRNWYDMFKGHRGYAINIDISTTRTWGEPNPHFGRPFMAAQDQRQSDHADREVSRATAFYELDFKNSEKNWMKWFGRHTGTLFAQSYMRDTRNYSARRTIDQGYSNAAYGGNTNLNRGVAQIRTQVYIGDSFADANGPTEGNIYGVRDELFTTSTTGYFWNTSDLEWQTATVLPQDVRDDEVFWKHIYNKAYNRQITDSYAYVHQAYLFNSEWLVGTFGYRKDEVKSYASGTPRDDRNFIDIDALELNEEPSGDPFEAITRSYGLVAHVPEFVPLPDGVELSLHWGESENFQIAAPRITILGDMLSPPGGTTEDYGFTLSLMDRKLLIRTNFYKSESANVGKGYPGFLTGTDDRIIAYNSPEAIAASGYQGPPQFYRDLVGWRIEDGAGTISGYRVARDGAPFALSDSQSTTSEGMEIDIVYNPTKNWRIAWNISKQEAMRSNLGPATREYLTYRFDEWTSTTPGGPGFLIADESDQPVNVRVFDTLLNSLNADLAREGAKVPELREWRTNVITNYTFDKDSRLGGFNVGGAFRWEDEKAIGYPIIEREFDGQMLKVPDLDNPYTDDPITKVDLWVGYKTKIWDGKIDWKLQLNLQNVFSDGEVVGVSTQPDGSIRSAVWREGRTFSLRSVFEF
ncbi:MAG: hypothetical protein MI748_03335 [Opitutales bacterium]|nr:hypothetical protein [Opitutales bacterium]